MNLKNTPLFGQFKFGAFFLFFCLTACVTTSPTPRNNASISAPIQSLERLIRGPSEAELEQRRLNNELRKLPITDPLREADLNDVWYHSTKYTKSMPVADNRIQISSYGTLIRGSDYTEQNFFIRASAETLRSGYDGFVILHMEYRDTKPKVLSFIPDTPFLSKLWIGNYEDYSLNRHQQNLFSGGKAGGKTIKAVILVLDEAEYPTRDRFSAQEIFDNYLSHRAAGLP